MQVTVSVWHQIGGGRESGLEKRKTFSSQSSEDHDHDLRKGGGHTGDPDILSCVSDAATTTIQKGEFDIDQETLVMLIGKRGAV